jgi:hypothetical protein
MNSDTTKQGGPNQEGPVKRRAHDLKVLPIHFTELCNGNKNFEVRRNDCAFHKGDLVILREYDELLGYKYTGREMNWLCLNGISKKRLCNILFNQYEQPQQNITIFLNGE